MTKKNQTMDEQQPGRDMVDPISEITRLQAELRTARERERSLSEQLNLASRYGKFCHDAMDCMLTSQGRDSFLESFPRLLIDAAGCDEVLLLYVDGTCRRWNREGPIDELHACGGPCPFGSIAFRANMADLQEFPDLQHDPRIDVPPTCPTQSLISYRFKLDGKPIGVLVLLFKERRHEFTDADRRILVTAMHLVSMCEYRARSVQAHESEVLLRSRAIQKTPLSIYIKDADNDFRYVEVNEFTCRRMGMTRDQFIGRNDAEIFSPEIAAPYIEVDRKAMEHDGVTTFLQEYLDPSGVLRPVSSVRYPVTMPDGRRILVCYSVEISEFLEKQRKIEELQRRTAEERDRAVLAEEVDSFVAELLKSVSRSAEKDSLDFVLSEIGKFVGADRSYIYMFKDPGRSGLCSNDNEWCADGVPSVLDSQQSCDMEKFPGPYAKIMAGEDVLIPDVSQIPSEARTWLMAQGILSLIITPVKNLRGEVVGFIGFDFVTQKIDNFGWKMAHVLHEASDIISICRSRHQFYLAMRAAEKAQTDFFASVSHDIRTPLNSIIGFSELLKGERDPDVCSEYLERISFSGNTLLALINDVLDLSKLDSAGLTFHCVPVDFPHMLKLVACTFESVMREKGLKLKFDVGDMPVLRLDEHRTRQVCFNLMGNAVKYTDTGSVTISAKFTPRGKGHGELVASVSDTGLGIAPEDVSKLMRPYVRIQRSTESRGGTGLGLSICKRIVEAFGGTITVESELGKGSTFTVTIKNVRCSEESLPANTRSLELQPSQDLSDVNVLIVDDLKVNRRVLSASCRKFGVGRVVEADSGESALAKIDAQTNLVLCDMKMPGMDGAAFIRALRELPEFDAVPVVLVTADVEARKYGSELGADGVLLKPVVLEDLLRTLVFSLQKFSHG